MYFSISTVLIVNARAFRMIVIDDRAFPIVTPRRIPTNLNVTRNEIGPPRCTTVCFAFGCFSGRADKSSARSSQMSNRTPPSFTRTPSRRYQRRIVEGASDSKWRVHRVPFFYAYVGVPFTRAGFVFNAPTVSRHGVSSSKQCDSDIDRGENSPLKTYRAKKRHVTVPGARYVRG